jgi:hypothetical protein
VFDLADPAHTITTRTPRCSTVAPIACAPSAAQLIALQRGAGNAAVTRNLQRVGPQDAGAPAGARVDPQCAADSRKQGSLVAGLIRMWTGRNP